MKLNEKPFNEPQVMNVLLQMHMQSLLIYKVCFVHGMHGKVKP